MTFRHLTDTHEWLWTRRRVVWTSLRSPLRPTINLKFAFDTTMSEERQVAAYTIAQRPTNYVASK